MTRWFNGFIALKQGNLKEKFPKGIFCGEDGLYDEIVECNNYVKLIKFGDRRSVLYIPLPQVDYFEVWK